MTNDPTPDRNDPLRALDAVEPADRWDDVVSRFTEGELLELAPVTARRSFSRPLLAAAAVLAVLALAAGVFALTRGDDKTQNLATDIPGEGGRVAAPTIWNSTWELVALERDGEAWEVADATDGKPPRIVTTEPGAGAISLWACNHGSGAATQEGDQLVVTAFASDLSACLPEPDSALMDQELFVVELLADRPTIVIKLADGETGDGSGAGFDGYGIGERLTLTTDSASATFERTEIGTPVDGSPDSNERQALWGRMWNVVTIIDGGKLKQFVHLEIDGHILLDATTTGQLNFTGCNGSGGTFDLDGDRLKVMEIGPSTLMGCDQGLMDQDIWLQDFLEAEPTVAIDGNHLTLATDKAIMELEAADVAVGQPVDPAQNDPDGSMSSPPQPPGSAGDPGTPDSSPPQTPGSAGDPGTPGSTPPDWSIPAGGPSVDAPVDDPSAIWGRDWTVVDVTHGWIEFPCPPRAICIGGLVKPADGEPLHLDATATGQLHFNGCGGAGGLFNIQGNRLVKTEEWGNVDRWCEPEVLMEQEAKLQSFLDAGPSIAIDGDRLTLTTDQVTIDLVAA